MKRISLLFSFMVLILTVNMFSQTVRYRDEVFSAYTLTSNVQYGTTTTQMLDYYTGTGDTAKNRPVVLFIHGGGFKSGDKVSNFGTLECGGFAKRGYFVVSINYRLASTTTLDKDHFEAMIKALQDAKAAVRFLRKNYATYGIDTTKIFATGSSAGSITALHMAYLQDSEVPSYVDLASLGGNLEGSMGNPGYTSNIQGVISNWGALADYKWMAGNPIPVYCVAGTADATVPCDSSFGDGPFKYGAIIVNNYAQTLGYPTGIKLFTGAGHTLDNNSSLQTQGYQACAAWLYAVLTNPAAPLTLTSPIGGEVWQQGMAYNITWIANSIPNVNLDYSTDSGTSWSPIASSVAASSGAYAWTIPNTLSTTCLVRVSNSADATVKSISNSVFTITAQLPPALTLLSPVGGDSLSGGSSSAITWTSTNVTNIKIEYTSDNGSTWNTVVASVAAASGTYSWSVPNVNSTLCMVRISDASNSLLSSQSLNTFIIAQSSYVKSLLWEENFVQPSGVTAIPGYNGWAAVTGTMTGTQLAFTSDNLTFGSYPSNSGQCVLYTAGGTSKAFKSITLPVTDAVYLSFLIKVPTAALTQANHVIGFGAGDMTTLATYSLKTYCKWNATTLGYYFGVTSGSTATYNTTAPTTLAAGSVGLVILKYDIVGNTADLYVFTDTTAYPTSTLPNTSEVHLSSVTAFTPSCVYLRSQGGSSGTTVGCEIDGIRVATYWGGGLPTAVSSDVKGIKANEFRLEQNYPNPFNPSTSIAYNIPTSGTVKLSVLNVLGEEVMTLVNEEQNAGQHTANFNASHLASGVYMYRLTSGNYSVTKKMMLLK